LISFAGGSFSADIKTTHWFSLSEYFSAKDQLARIIKTEKKTNA